MTFLLYHRQATYWAEFLSCRATWRHSLLPMTKRSTTLHSVGPVVDETCLPVLVGGAGISW